MTISRLHRYNALFLAAFLALHMANHIALIAGIEAHLRAQTALRQAYRLPGIEHVLITLFAVQILLGLVLVLRRGWPKGGWAWAQVLSGLYLTLFLVQHLAAIILARLDGLDTNSYFAASVVSAPPFVWYFAPYYVLSITALFTHIAAALRFSIWPAPPRWQHRALPVAGLTLGVIAVAGLMGGFGPVILPSAYQSYLDALQ